MLKAFWVVDALCVIAALGMALFTTGQDQAGRGILWFFPFALGLSLAASWTSQRFGMPGLALGLAAVGPVIVAIVLLTTGRSLIRERAESSGSAYWSDPAMRTMARAIASGDTAAMRAAATPNLQLDAVGSDGMTLLSFAIVRRPDAVAPLIALGANPKAAAPGALTPLVQSIGAMDPAFASLLAGGADPNGAGDNGSPVIFRVIRDGTPDRYSKLMAHDADVNRLDAEGHTTLMVAAEERRWDIALDLLTRGVDLAHVAPGGKSLRTILERSRETPGGDAAYDAFIARLNARAERP